MKLVRCHIENFGNLSDFDLDFNENLTSIYGENGFGKSTIACFIKVMFYGMNTMKSNGSTFGDREHFYPFGGGTFGGSLTYEIDGKEIRIERTFDKKSSKNDTIKIYVDGIPTEGTDTFLGLAIFGLDEESFQKSIFIDSECFDEGTTMGIRESLAGIIGNDESENFGDAIAKLQNEKKEIDKRSGRINAISDKISVLIKDIKTYQAEQNRLDALYKERSSLEKKIKEYVEKEDAYRKSSSIIERRKQGEELLKEQKDCESKLKELQNHYPKGFPNKSEIEEICSVKKKLTNKEAEISGIERQNSMSEQNFDEIEITNKKEKIKNAYKLYTDSREALIQSKQIKQDNKKGNMMLPIVISLIVALAGLFVYMFTKFGYHTQIGIGLIVLGAISLFASILINMNRKINNNNSVSSETIRLEAEAESAKAKFYLEISNINVDVSNMDIANAYTTIMNDFNQKIAYRQISSRNSAFISELKEEREKIYHTYYDKLLEYSLEEYQNEENIEGILLAKSIEITNLQEKTAIIRNKIELFKKDNDIEGDDILAFFSTQTDDSFEIDEQYIRGLRSTLSKIDAEIDEIDEMKPFIEEKNFEIERLTNEQLQLKEKARLLGLAIEYLNLTEENIRKNYVAPIQKGFEKYATQFEKILANDTSMDREFGIKYERNGELRKDAYLSSGQKVMKSLALRFSIIDKLFEAKERPFIVLDDPFVFVDDKHMENALNMLNYLADYYQIVYFCCHNSRKL